MTVEMNGGVADVHTYVHSMSTLTGYVNTYVHTITHTYVHNYLRTYTPYIRTIRTCVHTYSTYIHTYNYTNTYIHKHVLFIHVLYL